MTTTTNECTADEWLQLAIDAEEMAKACGPFDPAFEHLTQLKSRYFQQALSAERVEHSRKK